MGQFRAVKAHRTPAALVLPVLMLALLAPVGLETVCPAVAIASEQTTELHPRAVAASGGPTVGKVVETMNGGGYTYVRVETEGGEVWAAGPQVAVAVGQTVRFADGMPMTDFHSKALDRTFARIVFVTSIRVGEAAAPSGGPADKGGAGESRSPHAGLGSAPAPSGVDLAGIAKAEGGVTVGAVYADKDTLAGQEVVIRARVVKTNSGIMGKNWLHLRDGTAGPGGENDLTVVTSATAEVGDTVLVRGKLAVNKDFGFGYRYDVILDEATVTVEASESDETKT